MRDGLAAFPEAIDVLVTGKPPVTAAEVIVVLDEHLAAAQDLGVEVDKVVDAPNTLAVFLRGPEGVRIEYVEHKPTFSLT